MNKKQTLLNHLTLNELVSQDALWSKILDFIRSRGTKTYLVGGYLRDLLVRRPSLDIDLATEEESLLYAQSLAAYLMGSSFLMDEAHKISRVVLKEDEGRAIDISTYQDSIVNDLKRRDFTIDALALDLGEFIQKGEAFIPSDLIDPAGGRNDLENSLVRMSSEAIFREDPVRLMRALRLCSSLGFVLEEKTSETISREAGWLSKAAPERTRDELFYIFRSPHSASVIELADKLGLLTTVIPELEDLKGVSQNNYHHLDAWKHSLLTLEKTDEIVDDPGKHFRFHLDEIRAHLKEELQEGISRGLILKSASLLHDIAKPKTRFVDENGRIRFFGHPALGAEMTEFICQRLRLSRKVTAATSLIIREHMRPGFLVQQPLTERAIYRFLRDLGNEALEILLLSFADRLAAKGPGFSEAELEKHRELAAKLIKEYFRRQEALAVRKRLVTGNDLMERFGLASGPRIGRLLAELEEAEMTGRIRNREEALELAAKLIIDQR